MEQERRDDEEQKTSKGVDHSMMGQLAGIFDRSATVPGFSAFHKGYKGLFLRCYPVSLELPSSCFSLKILLDVLDAGPYTSQGVTFSHEHVTVVTSRLGGQKRFSGTSVALVITVPSRLKPRTAFDLVSCEAVTKFTTYSALTERSEGTQHTLCKCALSHIPEPVCLQSGDKTDSEKPFMWPTA